MLNLNAISKIESPGANGEMDEKFYQITRSRDSFEKNNTLCSVFFLKQYFVASEKKRYEIRA